MKKKDVSVDRTLDRYLRKSGSPSPGQVAASVEKVWEQLRHEAENTPLTDREAMPRRFRFTVAFAVLMVTVAIGLYAAERGGFLPAILPVRQVLPPPVVLPTAQSPATSVKAAAETAQVAVVTPEARKPEFAPSREEILAGVAAQIAAAQNTDAGAAGPIQRVAFEVVSIRPYDPTAATAAGGRGGGGRPQICGRTLRVDPGRISVSGTTLFTLIALAYGKNCESANAAELVSGGPAWLKTDRFDIQATMAEGVTHSSVQQLLRGEAPGLQAMLQTLLSDRFKIVLRRETREMPVYLLTVAKNGHKLRPAKEGDPIGLGVMGRMIEATRASMVDLATGLTRLTGRPVLDRTNLSGEFTFGIAFAPFDSPPGSTGPSLFSVLEDDLGLKLEGAREKIEVLTVAHAEKPTEN